MDLNVLKYFKHFSFSEYKSFQNSYTVLNYDLFILKLEKI